jgi:DNA-binding ferritin-like protein
MNDLGHPYPDGVENGAPICRRSDVLRDRLAEAVALQRFCQHIGTRLDCSRPIELRQLYDSVHGAALAYADLLAERVIELGGTIDGLATLIATKRASRRSTGDSFGAPPLALLVDVLERFYRTAQMAICVMKRLGDAVSATLLGEFACDVARWRRSLATMQHERRRLPERFGCTLRTARPLGRTRRAIRTGARTMSSFTH